ncbi:MAG: ribonuclease III domain-containing protein [Candidatus Nanopelagicales bacterium]
MARRLPAPIPAPAVDPATLSEVNERLGRLRPDIGMALAAGRGRTFQRLEFLGDAILELVIHGHAAAAGPSCPICAGRADRFTTDANLSVVAQQRGLGDWLQWHASPQRLADLVEAVIGGVWVSGRWPATVAVTSRHIHPLTEPDRRRLLHGGAQVNPEAPARAREILGAAILECAATINAFQSTPDADEGELSRRKARLLSTEHVMSLARDSKWVRRRLRTHHFVRDDVEHQLSDELLARGLAAATDIALVLTRQG